MPTLVRPAAPTATVLAVVPVVLSLAEEVESVGETVEVAVAAATRTVE